MQHHLIAVWNVETTQSERAALERGPLTKQSLTAAFFLGFLSAFFLARFFCGLFGGFLGLLFGRLFLGCALAAAALRRALLFGCSFLFLGSGLLGFFLRAATAALASATGGSRCAPARAGLIAMGFAAFAAYGFLFFLVELGPIPQMMLQPRQARIIATQLNCVSTPRNPSVQPAARIIKSAIAGGQRGAWLPGLGRLRLARGFGHMLGRALLLVVLGARRRGICRVNRLVNQQYLAEV